MKRFSISLVLMFVTVVGFSQAAAKKSVSKDTNGQYKISFEIKNKTEVDAATLSKIDVSKYEHLRKESERVYVTDQATGLIIVLYSNSELKQIHNPLQILPNTVKNDTSKSSL